MSESDTKLCFGNVHLLFHEKDYTIEQKKFLKRITYEKLKSSKCDCCKRRKIVAEQANDDLFDFEHKVFELLRDSSFVKDIKFLADTYDSGKKYNYTAFLFDLPIIYFNRVLYAKLEIPYQEPREKVKESQRKCRLFNLYFNGFFYMAVVNKEATLEDILSLESILCSILHRKFSVAFYSPTPFLPDLYADTDTDADFTCSDFTPYDKRNLQLYHKNFRDYLNLYRKMYLSEKYSELSDEVISLSKKAFSKMNSLRKMPIYSVIRIIRTRTLILSYLEQLRSKQLEMEIIKYTSLDSSLSELEQLAHVPQIMETPYDMIEYLEAKTKDYFDFKWAIYLTIISVIVYTVSGFL